ncbi:solute carrier family 25 member 40-like [Mizuhopecten yessoensis]|uniref:Solute carrier family 25 member 40 n=1 Tax=Mizuhopecten yessoensis TaxID=6573 RepID=A0A210Q4M7_MIZYE|nr:solute carrier family 25 member 40-like [Mizuhopecten yessoensis]OWF43693.1 Solute carrier family 25 member 40 [Mizuhopecten yessoensis]
MTEMNCNDSSEKSSKHVEVRITPWQQMISSCSGAVLTSFFVTPLDVVKIRLQAQNSPMKRGQCFLYCNGLMDHVCVCRNGNGSNTMRLHWYKRCLPQPFTGTLDAFVKISRQEGPASLWSGLPPTLVMAVPATVVYFTCYEQCRNKLGYSDGLQQGQWWKPMAAGVVARTWAVTMISPLEMVRTKIQSEQLSYSAVWKAVRNMVRQEGVLTLWMGLGPTLFRDVPFSALYWFGYESFKSMLQKIRGTIEINFWDNFVSGAAAGSIAGVITLPFDVIKTHRQIELGNFTNSGEKQTSSTFRLIQKLYRQQGVTSLFTGMVPRVIKVAPACAIMISSYEYFKSMFREHNLSVPKSLTI